MTDLSAVQDSKRKELTCPMCKEGWQSPHFLGEDVLGKVEDYGHTCVFCKGKRWLISEEDEVLTECYKS